MAAQHRDHVDEDSVRPIRLWLPKSGMQMRYYYYSDRIHAEERALLLIAWQKVDEPIEVYHGHSRKLLAVYVQKVDGRIEYERFKS